MGIKAILRANQQSLPKAIRTIFASEFSGSSLSSAILGQSNKRKWSFLRGVWGISSSKLTTSASSSTYPLTVVDALVPDVKIEIKDMGQGIGAALWVTDAGNWWSVSSEQITESCNCTGYTYSCGCSTCSGSYCNGYNCVTGYYCPPAYCWHSQPYCSSWSTQYGNYCSSRYANGNCSGYTQISWQDCVSYSVDQGCYEPDCSTSYGCCSATYYFSCNCGTCSGTSCETCYPQYIRVLQSIASSVSEIVSWKITTVLRSLRVKTSNKMITVESFSDASLYSPIRTDSHNASTAVESTKFGIVVSPSSYNESKTVSEINIERGV